MSTKRLTQINDLVSGLGRVASGLQQKSKVLSSTSLQAELLSAAPIECSKVLSQSLSPSYLAFNTGCSKLKRKATDDGVEPPAKKRTLAQRYDIPLCEVHISSKCISFVVSE